MIYDKMEDCFGSLQDKVKYAIENSDLNAFFSTLDEIEGPTLVCGVGGSSIVAFFLAKVLREKRKLIADFIYPRDLKYRDLSAYENIIAVSYSGRNIGVDVIFDTDLNKYLLTGHPRQDCHNIVYRMKEERSYVSISATVVPLTLLMLYYRNDTDLIDTILNQTIISDSDCGHYEVMSGYETATAAMLLESSFIESGMAVCIIHDKYNFCHGRINISRNFKGDLIFFKRENELDDLLYKNLKDHYQKIITLDQKYDDPIICDYDLSIRSMQLIRSIALNKGIDISDMKELPDNDIFYLYKGEM
ncbi:MAG: hypothetical protein IJI46_02355 [Erysipelotrichaceae bacterium]|nr:hypothetical protein [Erysipelotrichaceae bacterium]